MSDLLLRPEQCCLHIIDPQQSLMAHIHAAEQVTANIVRLLKCATILAELMVNIDRPDKLEFNALANAPTRALIDKLPASVTTLILAGVETHICIYQTAMGALAQGLTPWIVADAVSSRTPANHELGLARLAAAGAIIGPAEMIIYELLGRAGTPEFKAMLPYII